MVQKTKAAETPELSQEDIQKIKKIIIERVWVDENEIIPEASLKDDLDFDSLDFIELIMVLEKDFRIHIDNEEMEDIQTVADLYEAVSIVKRNKACSHCENRLCLCRKNMVYRLSVRRVLDGHKDG